MVRHFLPLLLGACVIQLQYHTGHTQYVESHQPQTSVSTSFVNTPVTSINPYSPVTSYSKLFDQTSFIQPYSSGISTLGASQLGASQLGSSQLGSNQLGVSQLGGSQLGVSQLGANTLGASQLGTTQLGTSQLSYTVQDGRLGGQQQQFLGGGQSSFVRQQPSVSYFTFTPDTRTIPVSQQLSQPNFLYSPQTQGQLSQTLDTSVPVQREFVYPIASQETVRRPSQIQFTPNFVSRTQTSQPAASNEKFIPISSLRTGLPEESKVVTFGDNPFVITAIKPKSPSLQVLQNERNPLESLRTEDIIEALLNKGSGVGVRKNQIIVNTKSDNGRIPVTEAEPRVLSTTPTTEIVTEPSPTPTVSATPTVEMTPTTTPMPTSSTTTTTTTPPPPPVHFEVTTTEERHYVSRKKKITLFIKVEDAGFDAEEKETYATKQDFHEWTKTIVEPTDVYDEKIAFLKNDTREVEGPALGVEVTKVICRNFVDEQQTVVELDVLKERPVCPKPALSEGGSWEERAFRRIDNEIEKKLKDIFNVTKISLRPTISSDESSGSIVKTLAVPMTRHMGRTVESVSTPSGFLRQTIEAISSLAPKIQERHNAQATLKRDAEKPRRLVENQDYIADTTNVKLSTESSHDNDAFNTPNQTSKRETKPEVVEEVKKEEVKTEHVITAEKSIQPTPATTMSHIMLITRTPPVRPPNPYHHPTTAILLPVTEVVPTKTETLPVAQALSSSVQKVPSKPEENMEKTFFRRST